MEELYRQEKRLSIENLRGTTALELRATITALAMSLFFQQFTIAFFSQLCPRPAYTPSFTNKLLLFSRDFLLSFPIILSAFLIPEATPYLLAGIFAFILLLDGLSLCLQRRSP